MIEKVILGSYVDTTEMINGITAKIEETGLFDTVTGDTTALTISCVKSGTEFLLLTFNSSKQIITAKVTAATGGSYTNAAAMNSGTIILASQGLQTLPSAYPQITVGITTAGEPCAIISNSASVIKAIALSSPAVDTITAVSPVAAEITTLFNVGMPSAAVVADNILAVHCREESGAGRYSLGGADYFYNGAYFLRD